MGVCVGSRVRMSVGVRVSIRVRVGVTVRVAVLVGLGVRVGVSAGLGLLVRVCVRVTGGPRVTLERGVEARRGIRRIGLQATRATANARLISKGILPSANGCA